MSVAVCRECRSSRFVYDATHWDRICTGCGVVSAYELPDTEVQVYGKVKTYSRLNYFRLVVDKAVMSGTHIAHMTREWLEAKFICLVNRFERLKDSLGAKSFPSYGFMLVKLLLLRGIEPVGIKLPKMAATLKRAESVWGAIQDAVVEWAPSSARVLLNDAIDNCPEVEDMEFGDWDE